MIEIVDAHGLPAAPDAVDPDRRSGDAVRAAVRDRSIALTYRPVWDLAQREVTALTALPSVALESGATLGPDVVWSIADRAGLCLLLARAMQVTVEADQRMWGRHGLGAPVSIARIPSLSAVRTFRRRTHRSGAQGTVGLDLAPQAASQLFGLRPDRRWRVHLAPAAAVAEIRRCSESGLAPDAVRLSALLVHRFTRDAAQLRRVARCIEVARGHGLLVHADGAEDGESVNGLAALGCHQASGAGLGADLTACEIPTLRWVGSTLRSSSDRPLPAAAG